MSANISNLNTQIQNLITTLKSQGKDTTALQTSLDDATTQLTTITNILTTDKTLVQNVTVATSNPQSVFVTVRKDLATVRADFAKIRSDYASLRETFKIIIPKGTVTIKPKESSESAK